MFTVCDIENVPYRFIADLHINSMVNLSIVFSMFTRPGICLLEAIYLQFINIYYDHRFIIDL